ncbi:transposase [Bradyrhizobium sp. ma5]|uniref:transposase n=1 Tax=Bradyrhizobium sp. ma5 TaxID=3344828 RepID=UPI0035D505CA
MLIPGIGTLGATAVLAPIGNGLQSRKIRGAWLGLVPRQHSTGGKADTAWRQQCGNRYPIKLLAIAVQSREPDTFSRVLVLTVSSGAWPPRLGRARGTD